MTLRSAKKFITKLGAHYVHMTAYVLRRLPRPFEEVFSAVKAHLGKKPAPKKHTKVKFTAAGVFDIVFPIVCLCGLFGAVKYVQSLDYVVAVEIDGEDVGIITSDDVYGEAQRVIAEKMENYETDGGYYKTARLTVRPASSGDTVIDHEVIADKLEQQISDMYPETQPVEAYVEQNEEIDFGELIADENDPNVIPAVMVKADNKVVGFVTSYDKIEEALEEMKSVCYGLDGVEPENVFFDKTISFEAFNINKMAVVDQEKIIEILSGDSSTSKYYEVQPGDYLIQIAQDLGMTLDELMECKATNNGREVSLGDNISVGTRIEISSYEPYLTVEYNREKTYENDIAYSTITIEDDTLPIGQKEIQTKGSDGRETVTALITYAVEKDENGKLISKAVRRKIIAREPTVQPVSEVIREGTKLSGPAWGTIHGNGDYFWPVDGGYISSPFGGDRNHKGLDIAAPLGTPIYAAADGTVIDVGSGWNGGYGNCVIIQNDDGNITYYAHQSETACEVGDHVDAGQLIGYVGSTGDSTGNHLHFEVRCDGYLLDPEEFVSQ